MDRRTFLAGTGAVLLASPLATEAQQPAKVRIVALVLGSAPASGMAGSDPVNPLTRVFVHRLRDLGWIEGRNLMIDRRSAEGQQSALLLASGLNLAGYNPHVSPAESSSFSPYPGDGLFPG